ncbi:MAG TPA: methyl-accepting chemotaxis protein, partial [Erwinia sp.]|nr:methyl-accepting chemotaxis protein [Erwinia sp.]
MISVKDLKVGVRLGAAFGLVIFLLIVVSVTAIVKISSINGAVDRIVNDRYIKVRLAFDARDGVNEQIKYLRGMVIETAHPEKNVKRYGQLDSVTQQTNQAIEHIARLQTTEVGIRKIQAVKEAAQQFESAKNELLNLVRSGNQEAAADYALMKITPTQTAYLDIVKRFADSQSGQLQAEGANAVADGTTATRITVIFSSLAALLAVVLGYFLTRSIVTPLREAVKIAENVAAGDLRTAIRVNSTDETGQLMQALKTMNENLLRIVTEVRSGTELIATASGEISLGNMDLSSRTEQQASSLQETASAMEQITSTVKQNA